MDPTLLLILLAFGMVYLAHGRIIKRGTHQELMALGGEYAAMYMLQNASREESYYDAVEV